LRKSPILVLMLSGCFSAGDPTSGPKVWEDSHTICLAAHERCVDATWSACEHRLECFNPQVVICTDAVEFCLSGVDGLLAPTL
jgi:hypothetical protein